jgi:hypothetical protein
MGGRIAWYGAPDWMRSEYAPKRGKHSGPPHSRAREIARHRRQQAALVAKRIARLERQRWLSPHDAARLAELKKAA